jgi:general secretion pathway protein K
MLPFVTVFSNLPSINVMDAEPQVLAALPGMTPENLQSMLSQRGDPSVDPHALIDMAGGEGATLAGSRAYRIAVEAELPDGRRDSAEVVILLLESGDEPYRVLSWRNASDGSTRSQKAPSR